MRDLSGDLRSRQLGRYASAHVCQFTTAADNLWRSARAGKGVVLAPGTPLFFMIDVLHDQAVNVLDLPLAHPSRFATMSST